MTKHSTKSHKTHEVADESHSPVPLSSSTVNISVTCANGDVYRGTLTLNNSLDSENLITAGAVATTVCNEIERATGDKIDSERLLKSPTNTGGDFVAWEGRASIYPHVPKPHRDILEQLLANSDDPVDTLRRSEFDGFLNVGIILLLLSLFYITIKNIQRNGFRVDLSAFTCPRAVYIRDATILFVTVIGSFSVVMIQFAMTKLWANRKIRSRTFVILYGVCQLILQGVGTVGLFLCSGGPIVSGISYMSLACFGLKMHSFYATNRVMNGENRLREKGVEIHPSCVSSVVVPSREPSVTAPYRFPANLTLKSVLYYYICVPVLVYEPSYPMSSKIRVGYIFEKLVMFLLNVAIIYILFLQFILPVIEHQESLLSDLIKMITPSFISWLCMFHAIFQCGLNLISEIAMFADRLFYVDWWNATTIDAFWRRWNRPVYNWTLRHVYLESQVYFQVSKIRATFAVFLLSALLHEFLFAVAFKTIRPFFFLGMCFQVPLIYWSRQFEGQRRGNLIMWASLMLSFPILSVIYLRVYLSHPTPRSFFCGDINSVTSESIFFFDGLHSEL